MAPRKKEFTPEQIAQGRWMYEKSGVPIHDIAAFFGIARNTLHNRINEWGWEKRRYDAPVQPDRRLPVRPDTPAPGEPAGVDAASDQSAPRDPPTREPAPPLRLIGKIARDAPVAERTALALRLQSAVERELSAIDRVLATLGRADSLEAERAARVLASLARTLREIVTLSTPESAADDDADDDAIPRDMDEFRRELARRMDAFASARAGAGVRNDAEAE